MIVSFPLEAAATACCSIDRVIFPERFCRCCESRSPTSFVQFKRTLVASCCFIAMDFFGGITRFPFFIFCDFLLAFFCFSASFEVPWAMVVGSLWRCLFRGVGLSLVLLPCASSTLVAAGLPDLSLVSVRQRRQRQRRQRRQRSRSPFRPLPHHVHQHSQAVTAQHASCVSSPAALSLSSCCAYSLFVASSSLLVAKGCSTAPNPVAGLCPSASSPRTRSLAASGHASPGPLSSISVSDSTRYVSASAQWRLLSSSDPQFSSRNLKRAAASSVGSDVGQSPYKRRRTDDLNDVPQHTNSHVSATTPGPESHAHNLAKKAHKSLTPMDHPPLNNQRSTPPNPADPRPALLSRASSSSARTPSHSREPSWQQQGALPLPQHPPVPPKLERPSPPSVGLASASSNTQWPSDASFSRRLSQSTSGQRTTSRRQPPSRLTLQPQNSQQPAARSLQPAIQSAPPIPMHGGPPNMVRPQGRWIPERPRNNVHPGAGGAHPSVVGVPNTSISTTNSILNAEATPAPAIRSTARHAMAAYPALPTPTSLRLGALQQQQQQQLHPPNPPLQSSANPNAAYPTSPSPYGYRGPITPAVPSPLPVLGSGTGVSDKAKFMSKMSEIYDRATSHRNCVSMDEVDRRIKEATSGLQQETVTLRKEVEMLMKQLGRKERSVEIGEGDRDVTMEPVVGAGEGPAAMLKGPVLPELPRIEPPTPQSEHPSVSDGLAASLNGRVAAATIAEKGKEKERESPQDMTSDKETPPK